MNTSYSPQKHAVELENYTALLTHQSREISLLHGKIDRLLNIVTKERMPSQSMDALVASAFAAMGERVWIVAELMSRSMNTDEPGLALARAIEALGCKPTCKSLGIYLARGIPSGSYVTANDLEIRSCGTDSTGRMWTVQMV